MEDDSQSSRVTDLPEDVVAIILQHLPVHQRAACALISQTWATVAFRLPSATVQAAAATQLSCDTLRAWIQQHGGSINTLDVTNRASPQWPQLALPCAALTQLQSLSIARVGLVLHSSASQDMTMQTSALTAVQAAGSSTPAAATAAATASPSPSTQPLLPQLQHVDLKGCSMPRSTWQQLGRVTSITSLQLQGLRTHASTGEPAASPGLLCAALQQLLAQLPALADLSLSDSANNPLGPVQLPTNRPALHRLSLGGGCAAVLLSSLPGSLTYLSLHPGSANGAAWRVVEQGVQLTNLTNLQHLQLSKVPDFPAHLLASMTALQHLSISHSTFFVPAEAAGSRLAGVGTLLVAVRQLPRLQRMECSYLNEPSVVEALAAATRLTAFVVTECGQPIQSGVLAKVLKGKRLAQLRLLHLHAEGHGKGGHRTYSWDHRDKPSCVDASDLRSIAVSCTGLQDLSLSGVVASAATWGCLQGLSGLQRLSVTGTAVKDATAGAIAQVPSLKSLVLSEGPLSLSGLQRLSVLTGLVQLEVAGCGLGTAQTGQLQLSCAEAHDSPSVSKQLQDWCDAQQAAAGQDSERSRDQCTSRRPTHSSSAKCAADKPEQGRPSSQPATPNSSSRRMNRPVAQGESRVKTPNSSSAKCAADKQEQGHPSSQPATPNSSSRRMNRPVAQGESRVKTPNSSSAKCAADQQEQGHPSSQPATPNSSSRRMNRPVAQGGEQSENTQQQQCQMRCRQAGAGASQQPACNPQQQQQALEQASGSRGEQSENAQQQQHQQQGRWCNEW